MLAILSSSHVSNTHIKLPRKYTLLREYEVIVGPALPDTLTLCKKKPE